MLILSLPLSVGGVSNFWEWVSGMLASVLGFLIVLFIRQYLVGEEKKGKKIDTLFKYCDELDDEILKLEKELLVKINSVESVIDIFKAGEMKDMEYTKKEIVNISKKLYDLSTTLTELKTKIERTER